MTALCDWGGEVEVAIALARTFPAGEWDTSGWDNSEWEQTDTSLGDFLDVTCDTLDGIDLAAGSTAIEGVVARWEAATATLSLIGEDYDPRTGQWAGLLAVGLPVRIRWRPYPDGTWSTVFLGSVADNGYRWDAHAHIAQLMCSDLTADLVAYDSLATELPGTGAGDTAAERVDRVLDIASVDPARRDITAGGVTLMASQLEGPLWDHLMDVADADLGLLWVRRDGRISFRPEGRVLENTPIAAQLEACPAEGGDGVQYVDLLHADPLILRNRVYIGRRRPLVPDGDPAPPEPPIVARFDDRSAVRFRPYVYRRVDMEHEDDDWSVTIADAVIADGAWPSTAPIEAVLDTRVTTDIRVAECLLDLEPEHAFTVMDPLDPATQWRMRVDGWRVQLSKAHVSGSLFLEDVTGWGQVYGWDDEWPPAGWDESAWGLSPPP